MSGVTLGIEKTLGEFACNCLANGCSWHQMFTSVESEVLRRHAPVIQDQKALIDSLYAEIHNLKLSSNDVFSEAVWTMGKSEYAKLSDLLSHIVHDLKTAEKYNAFQSAMLQRNSPQQTSLADTPTRPGLVRLQPDTASPHP
jgi:hypothetical protein